MWDIWAGGGFRRYVWISTQLVFFTAQGFAKLGGGLAPPPSQRMSPYCSTPAGEARNYGQPCMTIGPVWCNRSQQGLQFRCQIELHSRVLKGRYLSCRGYKLSLRCPGQYGIFTKPCLAEFPLSECKLLMDGQDRARCIDKKLHQVYNPWIASSCHTMHLQYKSCPVPLDIHPEWNKDVKYMPYFCWPHVFAYGTVMRRTQSGIFFPVAMRMTGSSTRPWCVANALAAPFAWQAFTTWH